MGLRPAGNVLLSTSTAKVFAAAAAAALTVQRLVVVQKFATQNQPDISKGLRCLAGPGPLCNMVMLSVG